MNITSLQCSVCKAPEVPWPPGSVFEFECSFSELNPCRTALLKRTSPDSAADVMVLYTWSTGAGGEQARYVKTLYLSSWPSIHQQNSFPSHRAGEKCSMIFYNAHASIWTQARANGQCSMFPPTGESRLTVSNS